MVSVQLEGEVIYEALIEVKGSSAEFTRDAEAPVDVAVCLLFDMRLTVFSFTAVSGPQLIKASEPRSIIYAVIVHEVYFALSRLIAEERLAAQSVPRAR